MGDQVRVYQLHRDGRGEVTCQSRHYAAPSKATWMVAAFSVKQATYFAANRVWHDLDSYRLGILCYSPDPSNTTWTYHDGTEQWTCRYKHYQNFRFEFTKPATKHHRQHGREVTNHSVGQWIKTTLMDTPVQIRSMHPASPMIVGLSPGQEFPDHLKPRVRRDSGQPRIAIDVAEIDDNEHT